MQALWIMTGYSLPHSTVFSWQGWSETAGHLALGLGPGQVWCKQVPGWALYSPFLHRSQWLHSQLVQVARLCRSWRDPSLNSSLLNFVPLIPQATSWRDTHSLPSYAVWPTKDTAWRGADWGRKASRMMCVLPWQWYCINCMCMYCYITNRIFTPWLIRKREQQCNLHFIHSLYNYVHCC